MAHCDQYLELISAAMDGALSPAQRETLDAHLVSCAECKALYEELTAVHAALQELPPVEVPAGLTQRVMAAIARDAAPAPKRGNRWARALACAAMAAVVLTAAWHLGRPGPAASDATAQINATTGTGGIAPESAVAGDTAVADDAIAEAAADWSEEATEYGVAFTSDAVQPPKMAVQGVADAPSPTDAPTALYDPAVQSAAAPQSAPELPQDAPDADSHSPAGDAGAIQPIQSFRASTALVKAAPLSSADALALLLERLELSGFSIDGDTAYGPNDETIGFAGDADDGQSYLFEYSRLVGGHTSRLGVYSVAPDTGAVTQLFP